MLNRRNVTGFSTARLMLDRDTDRSKGYGYIEFQSGKEVRNDVCVMVCLVVHTHAHHLLSSP
jgi:hypothetical protein